MNNIDKIRKLHDRLTKLMTLYVMNDDNKPLPFSEASYEKLLEDMDKVDVGWFKLNPDSNESDHLIRNNFSLTYVQAKRILEDRLKDIESQLKTNPNTKP